MTSNGLRRLNWGCGPRPVPGWINADRRPVAGLQICRDIRDGLPLRSDSIDCLASMHALQDVPYPDLVPVLRELGRVLKPEGVCRLGLPDLDRAVRAYIDGDRAYFSIRDDEVGSLGGKFVTQIIWYGSVRTPLTFDFVAELLGKAGFRRVTRCQYRETASRYPEIVELDNRERESLFVEAIK